MAELISNRKIWNIAYPIILGSVAQNFINVIDTAFLGRLGEAELGAAAIGGVFYLVIIMFGYGLGLGTQIMIARRAGEHRESRTGIVVEHSIVTLFILSVLVFGLIKSLAPSFFSAIIISPRIQVLTEDYVQIRSWGIFFAFINMGLNAFFIGTARTRVITWSTTFMAVVNIILDWLLIFGNMGFPAMGIKGAALASVLSEVSVLGFMIIYTVAFSDTRRYGLFSFKGFNRHLWLRLTGISFPVMVQNVISLAVWFAFFVFVEKMGETELAVSNIIRSVYVILMIPIWGFSAASNTMVSFLIGRGQEDEVLRLVFRISGLCFMMVLLFVVVIVLLPESILSIYTDDQILIANSLPALYVVCGTVICFAFAMVFVNAVSGTGRTRVALVIEMAVIGVYLVAAYAFSNVFRFPVAVVWTVEFIYAGLIFVLSWIYLRYGRWRENPLQL
ncbi:MAG: MATE family efflux transporter [Marinilabiliales bacterium]|nr:MAG: MATE family efflux transporter [Marinilabiliales bacterium]